MAISRGFKSEEAKEFKRYIGIAPVFVKAVNPSKEEHEKLFNTTLEETPNYVGVVTDNDGNEVQNARVHLILQTDTDKVGFEMPLISLSLFIQNKPRVGATTGKTQVIDKYGRTAWASPEELAAKAIPVYSNGPADIDKDYRPAYVGEEELTNFVKTYLGIPDVTIWDNNLRKRVPNTSVKAEECECRFEDLSKIFKGDFSEITEAISFMPNNKIKVMLGVRTDVTSGKLYQAVYTKKFLINKSTNYSGFEKEIENMVKNAAVSGRTLNTEYSAETVHEYEVTPTTFVAPSNDVVEDLPFATPDDPFPFS